MAIPIDSIRPGDWVTGCDDLRDDTICRHCQPMLFDGVPLRVEAVSAPFVFVRHDDGAGIVLDTRDVGLTKLLPAYVRKTRKYIRGREAVVCDHEQDRAHDHDPRDCPRCGQRMVQRHDPASGWRIVCPECGYDRGPVEVGA